MDFSGMDSPTKKRSNNGAWTVEEDRKLAEAIAVHGARRWKKIANIAGLSRCGKSCRLRWLNYLRPNIKRGNISDQEEDLILRLHKLIGNRWSLIAGRLPGRTDNEIKNYWNSHLRKKIKPQNGIRNRRPEGLQKPNSVARTTEEKFDAEAVAKDVTTGGGEGEEPTTSFNMDEFYDLSMQYRSDFDDWLNVFPVK
ncbi:hypothetical protein SAY87_028529 [Trapa incisa]|uniref:Uncharacterized protein n=1 Tax=Trapa incisa TaxID=236973 RepID=A0AAN7QS44_9MYRT|nr:hypothetical protein SAY87_028529 [Trapa incisa]